MDRDPALAQLRRNSDLLLRAQQLGKTGYVISHVAQDRVYWSDSLFEQRKVPRREYFSRAEALEFIHPEDRPAFLDARDKALAERRGFELEMRILCGDGSVIWERGLAEPQFDADGTYSGLLTVVHDITESKNAATSLLEQEATYRTLLNGIGDSIFLSLDGRFVDCNDAALQMFHCTREQIIGEVPARFSPRFQPDGRASDESAGEKIAGAMRGERQFFEWRHRRFDGEEFDAEVTLTRVEATGQRYFFGVVRDISERKAAEIALKASHDKFEGAFTSSSDAMIVGRMSPIAGGGTVLDANPAVHDVLGVDPRGMIGRTIGEMGLIGDLSEITSIRERLFGHGAVYNEPLKLRRPDGVMIDVEISGSRFRRGVEDLGVLMIRDVTARNEAARKIRELDDARDASLRQLSAITDNLPVAISYQDLDGRFQFANRTLQTWFATDAQRLIGSHIQDLVSPEYFQTAQPIRERVAAGHLRSEATLRYPDGQVRAVEATFVPDVDGDGILHGYYTLVVDLTSHKAAEEELRQSQKMQAVGKLTGGVAHDFNNLLAVISGNLELAREALAESGTAKIESLLETARRAAERGFTLTRSLLSFARQQPLSPQVTDLNALARDMTELLRRTLPSNIAIEFAGAPGLWASEVDPGQLQNALLNLVVNARDAMAEGGRLTIETGNIEIDARHAAQHAELAPGSYAMLSVADTGTGMPPEVIARAFDPFYTTKDVGQGTGLGLSMVYGFAKQSGGHVTIDSAVGRGTTLKLFLPRWVGRDEKPAPRDAPAMRGECVLVVEDDEDMRFIAATMLRSLGYAVLEAAGGHDALEMLGRHDEVSLLISDVMLAGSMNGKRLAEDARKLKADIRILYMSGYSEDAIVHNGRLDPGVHFIQKPFRKQDLALKVREALDG